MIWDEGLLFGKYTATLAVIYGSSNEPLSAVVNFWVVPWKILGGAVFALLLLTILLYRTRKRWKTALRILIRGEKRVINIEETEKIKEV